jgi:hypothetical protein
MVVFVVCVVVLNIKCQNKSNKPNHGVTAVVVGPFASQCSQ